MSEPLEDRIERTADSREKSIARTHLETARLFEREATAQADDSFAAGNAEQAARMFSTAARLWLDEADRKAAENERTETSKL